MASVLEKVQATLVRAEAIKVEIVQKTARRDQLLERLDTEFGLKSVELAEAKVKELDEKLVKIETEMNTLQEELEEAISGS